MLCYLFPSLRWKNSALFHIEAVRKPAPDDKKNRPPGKGDLS